jgi:hypothetical protein
MTGWWLSKTTPLKNDEQLVSWDDFSIPNNWESHNPFHGFQSPPTRYIVIPIVNHY